MKTKRLGSVFVVGLLAIAFVFGFGLIGCGSDTDAGSKSGRQAADSAAASAVKTDTATRTVQSSLTVTKENSDSLIIATVTAGGIPDSIALQVDQVFQRIHVVIKDISGDSLVATLHAAGKQRNIRINQIILPDDRMDGPFGHDIHYATGQKGQYTLIIGKDNMADGQIEGPVTLYLRLL